MEDMQEILELIKKSSGSGVAVDFSVEAIRRIAPTEDEREIFARKVAEVSMPPEASSEERDAFINAYLSLINCDEAELESLMDNIEKQERKKLGLSGADSEREE